MQRGDGASRSPWIYCWVVLLLSALFLGPLVVGKGNRPSPLGATSTGGGPDRVTDAPAPLP